MKLTLDNIDSIDPARLAAGLVKACEADPCWFSDALRAMLDPMQRQYKRAEKMLTHPDPMTSARYSGIADEAESHIRAAARAFIAAGGTLEVEEEHDA